jgi:hypothetical protein
VRHQLAFLEEHARLLDSREPAAFQNAFRCPAEHLEAHGLIAEFVVGWVGDRALVVSPDVGGIKRATRYRRALERRLGRAVSSAFLYALRNLLSGADGCKIGSRTPNVRHGVGY